MKSSDEIKIYVQKFQGGDKKAFESIYKMSYSYLHTCVIHVVRDEDTAQDILQDAYMEIIRNIGQLRDPENFLGWAAVIANRKCFALLKTRNRELLVYEKEEEQTNLLENIADNEEFIPESLMQNQEKQRLMREIIDGLTDMQRLCVIAFYYNQLSQEEIAQELGIPVNTVKSHLNRAKMKIKAAVIELDEEKGTKLYSLAPFMLLLLGAEAEVCGVPEMSDRLAREAGLQRGDGSWSDAREMPEASGNPDESEETGGQGKPAGGMAKGKIYALLAVGLAAVVGIAGLTLASRSEKHETPEDEISTEIAESQSETEAQEVTEQQELHPQELFVLDEAYENYGNAYGGIIPVKKDGLWGAVDYENQMIVPCEYDGFQSADKLGNIVMSNTVTTEEIVDMSLFGGDPMTVITHESKEYFLFDRQGNLLYQGEDEVRASGGMYITLHNREDSMCVIEYHRLDGTVLVSQEYYPSDAVINTFYDGISNINSSVGTGISVAMNGDEPLGPREGDVIPRIGTVDLQGNVSWRDDPDYYIWWDDINEKIAAAKSAPKSPNGNGTGMSMFSPRAVLSTVNHGYYITGSNYIEVGYLKVYDTEDNHVAAINYFNLSVDEDGKVNIAENTYNESNDYRGFYVDGGYLWNYGPHMVFIVDGKNVLVDFSQNTGDAKILDSDEIVTAVYDYIAMADEDYWLVQSGDQWGYIDHDGNEIAMFEDTGGFVKGYALVIEDGEVWLINEDFEKLESLGQADTVSAMGELYSVTVGEETHIYRLSQP